MARDSRDNWGEYSGKPGLIQKAEDGHVELTAAEQAQILRTNAFRTNTSATDIPEDIEVTGGVEGVTGEVWEDAAQRARKRSAEDARTRLNGRSVGEVGG